MCRQDKKIARWRRRRVRKITKHAWNWDMCARCCKSRLMHKHYIIDVRTDDACPKFKDSGECTYPTLFPWRSNRRALSDSMKYHVEDDMYLPPIEYMESKIIGGC
jgi:hypothetical protein